MNKLLIIMTLLAVSLPSFSYHKFNVEMGIITGNEGLYASTPDQYGDSDELNLGGFVNFSMGFEYFINKMISAKVSTGRYSDTMYINNINDSTGPRFNYSAYSAEGMIYLHALPLWNNRIITQVGAGVNLHRAANISYQLDSTYQESVIHDLADNLGYDLEVRFNTRKLNTNFHYYFGGRYNIRNFEINNTVYNANALNVFFGLAY